MVAMRPMVVAAAGTQCETSPMGRRATMNMVVMVVLAAVAAAVLAPATIANISVAAVVVTPAVAFRSLATMPVAVAVLATPAPTAVIRVALAQGMDRLPSPSCDAIELGELF